MDVPVIRTEHLTLREPRFSDFEDVAAFLASDRATGVGGPKDRYAAWTNFAAIMGHWQMYGYGLWGVEETDTGAYVGQIGLWTPEGWMAPEVGWWIVNAGFEGRGYAFEAAMRSRAYAYDTLGWSEAFSVIAPDNTRSIALAERMGATLDREDSTPSGKPALIYRHPAPEALQ